MKLFPFIDLKGDTLLRLTIRRVEPIVVTIGTTAGAFCAVAVGTCKPCIDGDLLNPFAKHFPEVIGIGVKSSGMTPWKYLLLFFFHLFK
jgi:hypothetical protein